MHGHGTPQMAFVSGGHLGQDVTLERLATLDGATGTNTKALFRAALGLHFGAWNAPLGCAGGAFEDRSANLLAPSHFDWAPRLCGRGAQIFKSPPQCRRPGLGPAPVWPRASSCPGRSS